MGRQYCHHDVVGPCGDCEREDAARKTAMAPTRDDVNTTDRANVSIGTPETEPDLPFTEPELVNIRHALSLGHSLGVYRAWPRFLATIDALSSRLETLERESYQAREQCPVSRKQDFLGASLLDTVKEQVRFTFWLEGERDRLRQYVETLERERDEPKLSDHINRADKRRIAELESTLAAQTAELARLKVWEQRWCELGFQQAKGALITHGSQRAYHEAVVADMAAIEASLPLPSPLGGRRVVSASLRGEER